jgi:DNA-binding NarL/FixJ family response regulator
MLAGTAEAPAVRVAVVDDHALVREGTRLILEEVSGLRVVGAAANGAEALRLVEERRPDVLILDLQLPDMSGVEVARRVRAAFPRVAVLVLTAHVEGAYIPRLLQLGVRGYLPKTATGAELVAAVRAVAAGRTIVVTQGTRLGADPLRVPLTPREHEVLRLMAVGLRNADIAQGLTVSVKTVEHHVTRVFEKLGVQSRTQALIEASEHGLLPPPT